MSLGLHLILTLLNKLVGAGDAPEIDNGYLLEDGVSFYLLEDGSGVYLLE